MREENEKKIDYRTHKDEHKSGTKIIRSPKEEVNERMKNFGDNF